jgi:hypothetical protein
MRWLKNKPPTPIEWEPTEYSQKEKEIKTDVLDHLVDVLTRTGDQELGIGENKKSDRNERSDFFDKIYYYFIVDIFVLVLFSILDFLTI